MKVSGFSRSQNVLRLANLQKCSEKRPLRKPLRSRPPDNNNLLLNAGQKARNRKQESINAKLTEEVVKLAARMEEICSDVGSSRDQLTKLLKQFDVRE